MTELDWPPVAPDDMALERKPKVCRHQWGRGVQFTDHPVIDGIATLPDGRTVASRSQVVRVAVPVAEFICSRCNKVRDPEQARRGKQSRNYGNRAELEAARRYGGVKVGAAGGPVDIRGTDWNTQMKTHRRKPPAEWVKAFSGMAANRERMPRLLLRFVLGPGQPPDDYFVVRGSDWLSWHGKDETE